MESYHSDATESELPLPSSLGELLNYAASVVHLEWSLQCSEVVSCLSQDLHGLLIGTQSGWIKRLDRLGNLISEFLALEGEAITVIASWQSAFDNTAGIVVGTNHGSVAMFRSDGERLWYANVDNWVGGLFLRQEGNQEVSEIIIGTHDGKLVFLDRWGNEVDCVSTSYTVLTAATQAAGSSLDHILMGTRDGYIICLNQGGKEIWSKRTDGWVYRLHQFLAETHTEMLLTGIQNGDLIAWDQEGGRLWKQALGYWVSGVSVGDLNGDGVAEILATTRNGMLYILHEKGNTIWRWNLHEVVVDAICLQQTGAPAKIIVATENGGLKSYAVSGIDGRLLQQVDAEVQNLVDLSGLAKGEASALESMGFVMGQHIDIPYGKTMEALQNHTLLPEQTAAYLRMHLETSPVLQMWSHQVPSKIDTISWFCDRDGESGLIVGSVDGAVSCWSDVGQLKWRFLTIPGNWIWSVRTQDVNDDGASEIIVGTKGRHLLLLDRTGKLLQAHTLPQGIRSVFVVARDGQFPLEFLLGCEDAALYVLGRDGTIRWKYLVDSWIRSVIAADLNHDHGLKFICGSRGGIAYELDRHGNLVWRFDAGNWIRVVYACDLDGDGKLELILGCDNGKIFVFGEGHSLLWTFDIGFRIEAVRMIELDGNRQLLVGSESQALYSLTARGELAWTFKTMGWVRDIEVLDLDQDGCLELVLSTFSVIQSIQKTNYYLQAWKLLNLETREQLLRLCWTSQAMPKEP